MRSIRAPDRLPVRPRNRVGRRGAWVRALIGWTCEIEKSDFDPMPLGWGPTPRADTQTNHAGFSATGVHPICAASVESSPRLTHLKKTTDMMA